MKSMTLEEYRRACVGQGVAKSIDVAMICPMCQTVQSARDLIAAGAGQTLDDVEKYLGFSCFGRFKNAGAPRKKPDGNPCNWTLGGLFSMHKLEVVTPDGERHPRFELATPAQEQAHAATHVTKGDTP